MWVVGKATLNEPKVFGYFWAPKVTEKIPLSSTKKEVVSSDNLFKIMISKTN